MLPESDVVSGGMLFVVVTVLDMKVLVPLLRRVMLMTELDTTVVKISLERVIAG